MPADTPSLRPKREALNTYHEFAGWITARRKEREDLYQSVPTHLDKFWSECFLCRLYAVLDAQLADMGLLIWNKFGYSMIAVSEELEKNNMIVRVGFNGEPPEHLINANPYFENDLKIAKMDYSEIEMRWQWLDWIRSEEWLSCRQQCACYAAMLKDATFIFDFNTQCYLQLLCKPEVLHGIVDRMIQRKDFVSKGKPGGNRTRRALEHGIQRDELPEGIEEAWWDAMPYAALDQRDEINALLNGGLNSKLEEAFKLPLPESCKKMDAILNEYSIKIMSQRTATRIEKTYLVPAMREATSLDEPVGFDEDHGLTRLELLQAVSDTEKEAVSRIELQKVLKHMTPIEIKTALLDAESHSVEEIAEILNEPFQTTKKRLYRLRQKAKTLTEK